MSKPPARRGDLTADLLADLEADAARDARTDPAREAVVTPMPRRGSAALGGRSATEPSLQTTLRITPTAWRLPGLRLRSGGFTGAFGPVEIDLSLGRPQ